MAYLTQDEELLKQQQEAGQGGAGGSVLSGGSSGLSSNNQKTGSGQWTNLNTYIDTNKEQTGVMADNAINNLKGREQNIYNTGKNLSDTFNKSLDYEGERGRTNLIDDIGKDPVKYNTGDYNSQLKNIYNRGAYSGAKDVSEYNPYDYYGAVSKSGEYGTDVKNTVNPQGRGKAFSDIENENITRGQKALNNMLIGASPDVESKFGQYREQYNPNLQSDIEGMNTASRPGGEQYANQADLTQRALKSLYGDIYQPMEQDLQRLQTNKMNDAKKRAEEVEYNNRVNPLKKRANEVRNESGIDFSLTPPPVVIRKPNESDKSYNDRVAASKAAWEREKNESKKKTQDALLKNQDYRDLINQIYGEDFVNNQYSYIDEDIPKYANWTPEEMPGTYANYSDVPMSEVYNQDQSARLQALRNLLSGISY